MCDCGQIVEMECASQCGRSACQPFFRCAEHATAQPCPRWRIFVNVAAMAGDAILWRLTRIAAVLAPLLLLVGDCLAIANMNSIWWTLLLWLSFACFVPALAGTVVALSRSKPVLAAVAGVVVLIGTMAGAGMQAYFRTGIVLENAGHEAAVSFLRSQRVMLLTSQVPGICFPIGLLLLSFGVWRSRLAPAWVSATLALGAVLFPVGHAARVSWALVGGDVVLAVAFAALAMHMMRGAEAVPPRA